MELPSLATDPARGTMGATSPEQFGEVFAAAYRTRDAEAVADMYEDNAIFATPEAGYPTAIGRAAIVQRMRDIFATANNIEWTSDPPAMVVVTGDYVIVHQTSRTRSTLADGTQHEAETRATSVLHRGTDGNWRLVIDHGSSL
jgi:uncharacterized protein (TIGR02246 family)